MGPSFGGKRQKAVRFLHCPVPDFGVLHDASLLALVGELQKAMAGGHVLYVHCMGGHGRTGTIVANLISAVDGVDFPTAMRKLQRRHRGSSVLAHAHLNARPRLLALHGAGANGAVVRLQLTNLGLGEEDFEIFCLEGPQQEEAGGGGAAHRP